MSKSGARTATTRTTTEVWRIMAPAGDMARIRTGARDRRARERAAGRSPRQPAQSNRRSKACAVGDGRARGHVLGAAPAQVRRVASGRHRRDSGHDEAEARRAWSSRQCRTAQAHRGALAIVTAEARNAFVCLDDPRNRHCSRACVLARRLRRLVGQRIGFRLSGMALGESLRESVWPGA